MRLTTRLFRHLMMTKAACKRIFPERALEAIQNAITQGEKVHRAEVRVIIEPSLSVAEVFQGESARERAWELFSEYRVWDTEENCGVLIYINLADHKVEIVADRASARALHANDWQAICKTITQGFAKGVYEESVLAALAQLNQLLHQHFPSQGSTTNELSNQPLIV